MSDATEYRISVQKILTEDGLMFEGTVAEFPDVAVYCETAPEAYAEVVEVIEGLAIQYAKLGRGMPAPITRRAEYSGKFIVRTTRSLHRELSERAEIEGVSLNQYVVTVLSAHAQPARLPETSNNVGGGFVSVLVTGSDAIEPIAAGRPKLKLVGVSK